MVKMAMMEATMVEAAMAAMVAAMAAMVAAMAAMMAAMVMYSLWNQQIVDKLLNCHQVAGIRRYCWTHIQCI